MLSTRTPAGLGRVEAERRAAMSLGQLHHAECPARDSGIVAMAVRTEPALRAGEAGAHRSPNGGPAASSGPQ